MLGPWVTPFEVAQFSHYQYPSNPCTSHLLMTMRVYLKQPVHIELNPQKVPSLDHSLGNPTLKVSSVCISNPSTPCLSSTKL